MFKRISRMTSIPSTSTTHTPTLRSFWTLFVLITLTTPPVDGQCSKISNGGYMGESVSVPFYDSPCVVSNNLIISEKMTLTLDAGTEVRFAPGVMLAVNGTLIAKVSI